MCKRILRILHGWFFWSVFRLWHRVSYRCAILVLANENQDLDRWAVFHFHDFMKRKYADRGIIIWNGHGTEPLIQVKNPLGRIVLKQISANKIDLLYDYYSFDKFFENIVFTITAKPEENLLGRILEETEVNEQDAVCLALYHLRCVPSQMEE